MYGIKKYSNNVQNTRAVGGGEFLAGWGWNCAGGGGEGVGVALVRG